MVPNTVLTVLQNQHLRSQIETDVLVNTVISNFFGKPAKINKKFFTDSEYYLPVDHVIIVDCDVSEPHGLLHGYASNWRNSTYRLGVEKTSPFACDPNSMASSNWGYRDKNRVNCLCKALMWSL